MKSCLKSIMVTCAQATCGVIMTDDKPPEQYRVKLDTTARNFTLELTNSFDGLLHAYAPVFTSLSFNAFRLLMTGWILSVRHRYVTDLIFSSDSVGNGQFPEHHRLFSQAAWKITFLRSAKILNSMCHGLGTILVCCRH
jgi:hypothetical protein